MVKGKDNFKTIKCRKTGKTSLHCFGEISILLSGSHLENTFSRWYLRIIFNKFTGSYKIYRTYKNTKEEAQLNLIFDLDDTLYNLMGPFEHGSQKIICMTRQDARLYAVVL